VKANREALPSIRRAILIVASSWAMISCNEAVDDSGNRDYPVISVPVERVVPDSILDRYRMDAVRLAVRHMEHAGMTEVRIPDGLTESLLNALGCIYAARALPARDTVMAIYPLHTFPDPQLYEIILFGIDASCEWVTRLTAGQRPVGQTRVDSLMSAYDLSFESAHGIGGSIYFVVLRSSSPLQIRELVKRFSAIPCMAGAEPNGVCCDGSDIRAVADGDAWKFTFRLAWGDCPAGCIASHYWDFRVRSDGVVEYLGSRGSNIPEGGPHG
jgi:hypothetical protein